MDDKLTVTLLGPPGVARSGENVELGTRKALALLAFLAVAGGPVPRSELDALLWPEHDDRRARRSLRDELSRLRRALGSDALRSDARGEALDPDRFDVDLWRFHEALEDGRLPEALEACRGPFLAGLQVRGAAPFESWLLEQRDRVQERQLQLLVALAEAADESGDPAAGLAHLRRALELDPLAEDLYHHAIRLAGRVGDRSGARALFARLETVFREELGVPPSDETRELYQAALRGELKAPDLLGRAEAPPQHNLPTPLTPLVGRQQILGTVRTLLHRADVRLVTLTGPGGVGKTRLGLQVARDLRDDFPDGVTFVPLAAVADPALVLPAVARALDVPEGGAPAAQLASALRERQLLLLLDNLEQVVAVGPALAELLRACPGLKLLATSRGSLRVRGEHEVPLPPLALPDLARPLAAAELERFPAVELFVQRARAADPGFALGADNGADVAAICMRLDGLPLAIELAAARTKLLSPAALLRRLEDRFRTLTGGPRDLPERQRTLHATLLWSFEQLEAAQRRLLAQLGVFVGGFELEAAESVAEHPEGFLDGFTALIDQSLVQRGRGPAGEPRFGLLESVRAFALERLAESGELAAARQRHAEHFLALVEGSQAKLAGADQAAWGARLEADHDNLRAALGWAVERQDADVAMALCAQLWPFWVLHGHFQEGRRWHRAVLALPAGSAEARARTLNGHGALGLRLNDHAGVAEAFEAALALWRELGNEAGVGSALNNLGILARTSGDYRQAARYYRESLAIRRRLGKLADLTASLRNLGTLAIAQQRWDEATRFLEECLELARQLGDRAGIGGTLSNLGLVALQRGDLAAASDLYREALELAQAVGDRLSAAIALGNLGNALFLAGEPEEAQRTFLAGLELSQELGDREGIASCLEGLAAVAASDQPQRAAHLVGAAVALRDSLGIQLSAFDRGQLDGHLRPAREQLGDDTFARALGAGRMIALDLLLGELIPAAAPAPPGTPSPEGETS